jgi:uncharacterized protein YyaL (SSP411 family)
MLAPLLTVAILAQPIEWRAWTPALFEQARREKRFVLLDLEAVWCHWCHVMDATTYADAKVVALVRAHYLAARVDEDSDPPLSERYGDYGWPATIVLDGEGREIVKRRGYLPPAQMAAMLQAIVDDPTPGPSVVEAPAIEPPSEAALSAEQRARLERRFREAYDGRYGGWGSGHKFVDSTFLGLALLQAKEGDASAAAMVRKTLDAARGLVDREWGGMDQYSATPDWRSPHFEKLLSIQAEAIDAYASAYSAGGDPRDLELARGVERYVARFLTSPEGALYTSQDADLGRVDGHKYWGLPDGRRRKLGLPRIDRNVYARDDGWFIAALVALHAASGDLEPLDHAHAAARWVIEHRALPEGGFRHGETSGPLALGDTLAAGRAFLSLYLATAEREWLQRAQQAARFIEIQFATDTVAGFVTARDWVSAGVFQKPYVSPDENVALARFANLLWRCTGDARDRTVAERAMRWLAAPAVADGPLRPGILLADRELHAAPVHVTVVGPRGDASTRALFAAALRYPAEYKRTEWWDPAEGPPPPGTVELPRTGPPAAFACSATACSRPVRDPSALAAAIDRLLR